MDWKRFYHIEPLIREGRRAAAGCECVSFDLFDTLFIRRIHDPDLVKLPVARYISARAAACGIERSWQWIQKRRDDVEAEQRLETSRTHEDHEACYPVFMERLLRELFDGHYRPELLEEVTSYELSMESSMLVARQPFIEWLAELHQQGRRIFFISDIYLPADHLKVLAERGGFLKYGEELISSADTFLAKASGRAFPMLQERFGLDYSSWLHIGDNPVSDGLRPASFGIRSLVLADAGEKHRKAMVKRYVNYGRGRPFYRGRALQQLMMPHEAENVERPHLYREGYEFIGPLVGAFVQQLAEQCRTLGLTKVFFLSREGYTFKKVWEAITPILFPVGDLPEIEYLYVSRMALAGASCAHQGLTRESAGIAFLPTGNRDFRDLARIFQLDLGPLEPHFQHHRLSMDTCLTPSHQGFEQRNYVRFVELLEDHRFQQEIKRQAAPANEALIRYLESVDFFSHEQVAIVDIGWLGTIQRFLYDAVKHRPDCPRLHGYLFAATRGIDYPVSLKNSIQGVIYDRHRFDLAGSSVLYARDVFEEACRAPHPTLDGYELDGDGFRLKFRRQDDSIGQAEQEQDDYYAPLQQGIVDAAARYGAASALLGYGMKDYRPWLHYLLTSKLAFPKSREVREIRHRHHLDDFHGTRQTVIRKARAPRQLWDQSMLALRFSPLLRWRFFWRHVKDVLRN